MLGCLLEEIPLACTCLIVGSSARTCWLEQFPDEPLVRGPSSAFCSCYCHRAATQRALPEPVSLRCNGKPRIPTLGEDELQRSMIQFLEAATDPDKVIFFHIPNGGARPKPEAAILKGLGVRAGAPDLFIAWRPETDPALRDALPAIRGAFKLSSDARTYTHILGGARFAFVEVKTKRGRLSGSQGKFRADCRLIQADYGIATTIPDLEVLLLTWGCPLRGSTQ